VTRVAAELAFRGHRRHVVARISWITRSFRARHPGWRRCSSLTYCRYARSSRLAIRPPRSEIREW